GGFVFLSHQIGSAVGVWLAGRSYAASGTYEPMWFASIALALGAAVLAWLIDERPDAGRKTPDPGGRQSPLEPEPKSESSFARASLPPTARPEATAYSSSIRSA